MCSPLSMMENPHEVLSLAKNFGYFESIKYTFLKGNKFVDKISVDLYFTIVAQKSFVPNLPGLPNLAGF